MTEEILRLVQICDYDNAKQLIEAYLKNDKDNSEILDLYAEVLVNLDLPNEARLALQRSIQLSPESSGDKYMSLAEISDYKQAVKLYQKGIDVYKKQLEQDNSSDIRTSIANGFAALAELYMNTSLW